MLSGTLRPQPHFRRTEQVRSQTGLTRHHDSIQTAITSFIVSCGPSTCLFSFSSPLVRPLDQTPYLVIDSAAFKLRSGKKTSSPHSSFLLPTIFFSFRLCRPNTIVMNNSTTVRLICVLIDDDLKIRDSPFTIKVPTDGEISDVIRYVQEVTPSLKDRDHGKFSFFKPPSESPVYVSNSTHGLQLSRKHLGSSLCIIDKVSMFQEKGDNCRSNIDVVIHVGSGEHGAFLYFLIDKACLTPSRWHRWSRPAHLTQAIGQ